MTNEQRIAYNLRKSISRKAKTLARRNNTELPPVVNGRPKSPLSLEERKAIKIAKQREKRRLEMEQRPEAVRAVQAKQKREYRAKVSVTKPSKPVKVTTPKPTQLRPKLPPIARLRKAPEKRMPDRVHDLSGKIKVRLDSRTEVFTEPGYDIEVLKARYKIAV